MGKLQKFWEYVETHKKNAEYKHLRRGQLLWGCLTRVDDHLAGKITGTDIDPFHDDSKIDAFVLFITKEWEA